MAGLDLSAFDAVLKDIFLGPIRVNLNQGTILMSRLDKTADFIVAGGKKVISPLLYGHSQAVGARADNQALPAVKKSKYKESQTTVKHNYGRIYVTGPTIRASKTEASAFAKAVESEMKNMVAGLKRDINRQLIVGDGNGKLAQIDSFAGLVITVKNPGGVTTTTDATMFCAEDMDIDIYSSDLSVKRGSATITSVDEAAGTVTIDADPGMANDDWILRKGVKGEEMMGLRGIVDDGTVVQTLQGIDSSTSKWWRAKRLHNNGVLRDVTPRLLQQGYSAVEKQGLTPTLGITSFDIRDSYANQLTNTRQLVNTRVLEFGFEAIVYNNKPIVPDDQCPTSILFWLVESLLAIHRQSDFDWADEDGHILTKVSGYDAYEAFMYYDAELGTFRRNAHCVIQDLQ